MTQRTKTYATTTLIWTAILLFALAYVFTLTGCNGVGHPVTYIQGPAGADGHDAPPVSVVAHPATLAECPTGGTDLLIGSVPLTVCNGATGAQGNQGIAGQNGTNGVDGTNGSNGTNGTNGLDATPVTVVPLCPGVSNYGVFVEVALNIGGKLYAVYSQNGGFLTYLAPGDYSSNAIGSACNLTVHADGTVTH